MSLNNALVQLDLSEDSAKLPQPAVSQNSANPLLEILNLALAGLPDLGAGWTVTTSATPDAPWTRVSHYTAKKLNQGWKLHVSATLNSAPEVLARALPVLLAHPVIFKFASSLEVLGSLNEGNGALSQVGKFITVYPASDEQAVSLAKALDEATKGLAGPKVPSDRQLMPDSLVHYRYGGFDGLVMQTPLGEILPAMYGPDGELVPDRRVVPYQPPAWVKDPFEQTGTAQPLPAAGSLIAGKYYIVAKLYNSPRNTVFLGIDLVNKKRCVLKRANGDTGEEGEAFTRLAHEAAVLQRLCPDPRFPAFYGLVEHAGSRYLIMEDVEGYTLESYIQRLGASGQFLPGQQAIAWGREIASMLTKIHASGLVYRDLKTTNIIVTPDDHLRLIDFELARDYTATIQPTFGLGTRGYMSPQQFSRQAAGVSDDIYALGVILYYLATGAEPSMSPNPHNLLARPIELLNPAAPAALTSIVARCLDHDPAKRFATMADLDAALAACENSAPVEAPALGGERQPETEAEARARYQQWATRLAGTLCRTAQPAPGGKGLGWVSQHGGAMGFASRDLNTGSGGTTLALAELAAVSGDSQQREVLRQAAEWLSVAPRPAGFAAPGLYVGEAGVGTALLRAGQALENEAFIAEAARRGKYVASLPYASPDLFNGTAGRLRFHLWLWNATGDAEHLEAALRAGEVLVETAEAVEGGGLHWTIPAGYDGLSGHAYAGYAHGASGIADSLLDLYEVTGQEKFKNTALQTAAWLARLAIPTLDDGSGLDWPHEQGTVPSGGLWCHGASGVGIFFLHLDRLGIMPEARELVRRAAKMVARGSRWASPVLCHGLAGQIEFLLDVYQAWGDPVYLAEARSLGRLLEAFAFERNGLWFWSSEAPDVVSADLMVGYGGIALTLQRLAHPETQPRPLGWKITRKVVQ